MVLVAYKPVNPIALFGLLVMVMHFFQTGRKRRPLPGTEEPMITIDFITDLFCQVDEQLRAIPKHPEAHLWPSEVVTLGLLHALKGVGNRPFYRWLTRDYRPLFPRLLERTRLFRLFRTHQDWTQVFLAAPTVLGVIDTYGIELIHPMREGRSPQQIGRKGLPTICQAKFVTFFTPSALWAHNESGLHHSTYDDVAWPSGYAGVGRQYCVRPGHAAVPSPVTPHTRC